MADPHPLPTSLLTIRTLIAQAEQLYTTQPAQAIELSTRAYTISRAALPPLYAIGDEALGIALLHSDHYCQAVYHLGQAYQAYLADGATLDSCRVGVHYVVALAHTGQLSAALQLVGEIESPLAGAAKQNRADFKRLATLPLAVGFVQERLGNYEQALAQYERHRQTLFTVGDAGLLAHLNIGRGRLLARLGVYEEALSAFAHAEMLLHTTNNKSDLARLYRHRSQLLMQTEHYAEAVSAQQQAANLLASMPGTQQIAQPLIFLRIQFALAGQPEATQWPVPGELHPSAELLHELQTAQRAFAEHGALHEEILAWGWLGRCHEQRRDWPAARQAYQHILHLLPAEAEPLLEFQAIWGVARIAQQEQENTEALAHYENAIAHLEQMRQALRIESYRSAFLQDKQSIYGEVTHLLATEGRWEEAFSASEQAKARLISEKLAFRLQSEVATAAVTSNEQVRHLAQSLQSTLQQLDQLYLQAHATQTESSANSWAADITGYESGAIAALENLLQAMVMQIQHLQPVFSTLTIGQTVTLPRLQGQLGDALFCHYNVVQNRYVAFVIDQQGIRSYVALASVEQVAQASKAFTLAIERVLGLANQLTANRLLRHLPSLLEDVNRHLYTLYTLLIQPILASLPADVFEESKHLVISPEGILHALPFHAFYDGQQYLLERKPIHYVPSATVLEACRQRQSEKSGVLLLGKATPSHNSPQLAAVNDEIALLSTLYPAARVAIGPQATTALFLAEAPRHRLLHIAAHAAFRSDRPMLSSITLADRNLTLAEIARLQLGADLVVLSGCETGFGQLSGGDLLSLASGFLGAGARSLLVSLWRVEDEATAQLMRSFYQAVQAGASYTDAIRYAQLALLHGTYQPNEQSQTELRSNSVWLAAKATLYRHPAFWAPFILVGSG